MRKPAFCICENKDADQLCENREADQCLCFHYIDSTIHLLSIYEISSLWQKRSGRPRKSWDEVIKNDREKLDMDSADPENYYYY